MSQKGKHSNKHTKTKTYVSPPFTRFANRERVICGIIEIGKVREYGCGNDADKEVWRLSGEWTTPVYYFIRRLGYIFFCSDYGSASYVQG